MFNVPQYPYRNISARFIQADPIGRGQIRTLNTTLENISSEQRPIYLAESLDIIYQCMEHVVPDCLIPFIIKNSPLPLKEKMALLSASSEGLVMLEEYPLAACYLFYLKPNEVESIPSVDALKTYLAELDNQISASLRKQPVSFTREGLLADFKSKKSEKIAESLQKLQCLNLSSESAEAPVRSPRLG
jgi:hypothetical protein